MFKARIQIIGINPYVLLPAKVLTAIFRAAGKDKGKIPVKMTIDGHAFTQTLVRYSGQWRLYLNTPMRKAAGKETGETATFTVKFNPEKKKYLAPHPKLVKALKQNPKAKKIFEHIAPSLRMEIIKYISYLKTDESIDRNVTKAIHFLMGKGRFVGRETLKL
ncbi:MAG TPA: YdeI/OmpD-associated family protein [Ohtaekwangia sp.]